MAKGVGLDAGEFSVKVVELDGSFRKPRLLKVTVDRVSQVTSSSGDPLHASTEAAALLHAIKSNKIHKQNVVLGFPSREALFRQLVVPFTGEDRIRKVIKFEAESEIHSQSVDDMVVDFHTVEEVGNETRVLVAGVPKTALRTTLDALEGVSIEPEVVDLDAMALLRVAEWSGALAPDDGLVDSEGASDRSRIILDLGARSVRMLVITDGHLHDMRAIPLGADSISEELATRYGCTMTEARSALESARLGQDFVAYATDDVDDPDEVDGDEGGGDEVDGDEGGGDEVDGDEGGGDSTPAEVTLTIPAFQVDAARNGFLTRLRRELMRFMVAVQGVGDIEAVFTTGGGSKVDGVNQTLEEVFGCEPRALLYMELLQHDLSEEEVARYEPEIAVAVGLALGRLGGIKGFNFRQEDLIYTRGFDRMKLPMAIACMLSLCAVFGYGMVLKKELKDKAQLFGWAVPKEMKRSTGRTKSKAATLWQYTGFLGYLVNKPNAWPARALKSDDYTKLVSAIEKAAPFARIRTYRNHLQQELKRVQRKGEYDPKLGLDSAVAVIQQFSGIFMELESQLGKFYVGDISVSLPSKPREPGKLKFKVFFRGADFSARKDILTGAFEKLYTDKNSAFMGLALPPKEVTFPKDRSASYAYDIQLKPSIPIIKL